MDLLLLDSDLSVIAAAEALAAWSVPAATFTLDPITIAAQPASIQMLAQSALFDQSSPLTVDLTPALGTWSAEGEFSVGETVIAAAPAEATFAAQAATFTFGTLTIEASPAEASWTAQDVAIALNALTIPATPALATWSDSGEFAQVTNIDASPALATFAAQSGSWTLSPLTIDASPSVVEVTAPEASWSLSLTIAASPALATWTAQDAAIVLGVAIDLAPALATWSAPAAQFVTTLTIEAAPAEATLSADGSFAMGSITVALAPALAAWLAEADFTVDLEINASPALILLEAQDATISAGATTIALSPALALWSAPAPNIQFITTINASPANATWSVPGIALSISTQLTLIHDPGGRQNASAGIVTMRRGDSAPSLTFSLKNRSPEGTDTPSDLTTATGLRLILTGRRGRTKLERTPSVNIPATDGQGTYDWQSQDLFFAGIYKVEVEVTFGANDVRTYPNVGEAYVVVKDDLGGIA